MSKQLRQLRELIGKSSGSERQRDAERKHEQRRESRETNVPKCANLRRRKRYEKDDAAWLRYYCKEHFWYKFTIQQEEMIRAIRNAIISGGDQSIAASRGEGKTMLCERLLLKYTLSGAISFSVLFAATGKMAEESLDSIKQEIEENERLLADYPEVCVPVQALENTPNRAHYQLVTGFRHDNGEPYKMEPSRFTWCGQEIILPRVPGSPSSGSVIATRGLDSAVRGLKKRNRRVDVAIIDDPDTEETVNSEDQAAKLEKRIDRAIAGLGGQQRGVARVMVTTLQNRRCVSFQFTDPMQKPSWSGKRFRFLLKPPDRLDLWDEYIQQRITDQQQGDEFARKAHRFFLKNRKTMERGAEVANPNRFNPQKLPDKTQVEVSALQRYYNEVARIGAEAVATEYDNDPPEESGPIESGITAHRVQRQVSGYERRVVPPGCEIITQGIDCRKVALHRVVRAFRADGTGYTIDYGVQDVTGTKVGTDDGLDTALVRALRAVADIMREKPYCTLDGKEVPIALTLVDAGWRTDAIYHACRELGLMAWKPAMGFGKTNGCISANFSPPVRSTANKKTGDGWFLSRQPKKKVWLVCMDTDRWKAWEHDRWMTPTDRPGSMFLFGDPGEGDRLSFDEKSHFSYSKHIVAEVEIEESVKGVLRRRWKAKSDTNHYLDASYMCDVAANMQGIRLLRSSEDKLASTEKKKIQAAGGWFAQQQQQRGGRRRA